jgi:site-specific DNA-cytosine methylase
MQQFKIGSIAAGMGMHLHGLKQIGGVPVWAIECDQAIASVYTKNHPESQLIIKPVQSVMPCDVEDVDLLIATPSCKGASSCKGKNRGESPEDCSVAAAIASFIKGKMPRWFMLENVWAYRNFQSFERITSELELCGYKYKFFHFNSADFGVAQSRKRLYLLASRDADIPDIKPPTTPVKGWWEAIADLIPTLPKAEATATQRSLIDDKSDEGNFLIRRVGSRKGSDRLYTPDEPAFTIRAFGRSSSNHWHQADICIDGELHALTPQACLRLFGDKEIADNIWLPPAKCLAMEVVGNGASWVMFKELFEMLIDEIHKFLSEVDRPAQTPGDIAQAVGVDINEVGDALREGRDKGLFRNSMFGRWILDRSGASSDNKTLQEEIAPQSFGYKVGDRLASSPGISQECVIVETIGDNYLIEWEINNEQMQVDANYLDQLNRVEINMNSINRTNAKTGIYIALEGQESLGIIKDNLGFGFVVDWLKIGGFLDYQATYNWERDDELIQRLAIAPLSIVDKFLKIEPPQVNDSSVFKFPQTEAIASQIAQIQEQLNQLTSSLQPYKECEETANSLLNQVAAHAELMREKGIEKRSLIGWADKIYEAITGETVSSLRAKNKELEALTDDMDAQLAEQQLMPEVEALRQEVEELKSSNKVLSEEHGKAKKQLATYKKKAQESDRHLENIARLEKQLQEINGQPVIKFKIGDAVETDTGEPGEVTGFAYGNVIVRLTNGEFQFSEHLLIKVEKTSNTTLITGDIVRHENGKVGTVAYIPKPFQGIVSVKMVDGSFNYHADKLTFVSRPKSEVLQEAIIA